jgi:hypothetical protein
MICQKHAHGYIKVCLECHKEALAAPTQAAGGEAMPVELFDGPGVYRMLKPDAQRRTSAENVSDVLDAVVRLMNRTNDAAPAAAVEPTDAPLWAVIGELRGEAHEVMASDKSVGIQPNPELADMLNEWADRLETTATAFYEDVYDQCAAAIRPLVDAGKLPGSVVESLQMLVSERAAAAPEGLTSVDIMRTVMEAQESCPHSTGTTNWAYWIGTRVLALRPATPDAKTAEGRKPVAELRAHLAAIAVVGQIDGHDVIRRLSVLDMADRGIGDQP